MSRFLMRQGMRIARTGRLLGVAGKIVIVGLLAFGPPAAIAADKVGRLFYLGVAFDGAPPEGKDVNDFNFATENLSALLTSRAEPAFNEIQVKELKGEAATHDAVMSGLGELQGAVNDDDIVFLYFGSHGGTSRKDGWGAGLAGGAMYGGELREALGKIPCQVIAMISTCGSGGFGHPMKKEPPLPPNVTALCACKRKESTGSQLDIAVSEALAGFADRDQNGDVTLRELLEFIPQRYLEQMTDEQLKNEASDRMPVLARSKDAPLNRALTASSKDRVAVWYRDDWRGGLRLGTEDGKSRVQFLGWDRNDPSSGYGMPDDLVEQEFVIDPGRFPPVEVEWSGSWYPGRILAKEGRAYRIHYLGYPASDDETVQPSRLRFNLSDRGSSKEIKVRGAGRQKQDIQLSGQEQKTLSAINAARQKQGLAALKVHAALVAECRDHAGAMANRGEALDSFGDKHPGDRIHGAGVIPIHWGITNSKGRNAEQAVKQWVESPIAGANVLEPHVNHVGIGVVADPAGGYYFAATYAEIPE